MKKIIFYGLILLGMGSYSLTAGAWERGACKEDIEKYCKNVEVGDERIRECLKKNAEKLSVGCKANLFDVEMKKKESEKK